MKHKMEKCAGVSELTTFYFFLDERASGLIRYSGASTMTGQGGRGTYNKTLKILVRNMKT